MSKWFNRHLNQLMYISGALIVIGIVAGILGYSEVTNITFIVATVVAIGPIINKAWMALTMKSFSIELLITIAVIGAMFHTGIYGSGNRHIPVPVRGVP